MGKIDKIRNYNQILLAVAGTLGIVFLCIAAFFALESMSRTFFRNNNQANNGILATEETNQLLQDSLRKQIISFDHIRIIDSINQTYLLPVTQANLTNAESTNHSFGALNNKFTGSYEKHYGNIYNNLILYKSNKAESKLIFDRRTSIQNFIIHESEDKKYIVISACSVDSNKDKFLNHNDLQALFIYNMQSDVLQKIKSKENYTTLSAYQPHQSNDLIVHFGIDRNNNGVFERSKEPMIYYKVNLIDLTLEEFVSSSQIIQLQSLLEGK